MYVKGVPEHSHEAQLQSWAGFCGSRLRKLLEYLAYLPLSTLRLLPKKIPLATKPALRMAQGGTGVAYLIGLDVDKERIRRGQGEGAELDLTHKVEGFKEELYAGAARSGIVNEGPDSTTTWKHLRFTVHQYDSWKELPEAAFEMVGGLAKAKQLRKAWRAKQPKKEKPPPEWENGEEGGGADAEGGDAAAGSKRAAAASDSAPAAKAARSGDAAAEGEEELLMG